MYQYIFFDLDGTLTDPGKGLISSLSYSLNKMGIQVDNPNNLKVFIGPPLDVSFRKFYNFNEEQIELGTKYYRKKYREKGIFENEVYPNIEFVLKTLKENGKILVLATSKPEEFAYKILKHFNLLQYFDFIGAATMDSSRSKKGDVIKYALDNLQIKNLNQVIMIGDRKYDIIGANENQLDSIGVLYGYGNKEELETAGAKYICQNALEILDIIL